MKKITLLMTLLLTAVTFAAEPPEVIFSQGSKCRYVLVVPEKLNEIEQAAVADLQMYMKKISGTELKIKNDATNLRIFFGRKHPGDRRDYSQNQRSVTKFGNDIFLYGGGDDGTAFAVYDLLEYLGCRWYDAWGRESIPVCRQWQYNFPAPQLYIKPSFKTVEVGGFTPYERIFDKGKINPVKDFLRRNRSYRGGSAMHVIGHFCHTFAVFIPPTGIPAPYPLCWPVDPLKDKKYFETNPEFFSMNKEGKRVPNMQLCFSNKELRKTMTENIEKVIAHNKLENAQIVIPIDCNDAQSFCYCPECKKYEQKYSSSAGAYYEYMSEIAPYFKKKYPKAMIRFLVGYNSEVAKFSDGYKFPSNTVPFLAVLSNVDRTKPVTHPNNRIFTDAMKRFCSISSNMWVYCYTDLCAIPSNYYHIYPQVLRLAEELKYYSKNNVDRIYLSGEGNNDGHMFQEMKIWIALKLTQDSSLDPMALAEEYINANYGAAAPLVMQFFKEIEAAEMATKRIIGWDTSHLVAREITGTMMNRWDNLFDQMMEKVKYDQYAAESVKSLRWILDYNIASRWDDFVRDNPDKKNDLAKYHHRCRTELLDIFGMRFSKNKNLSFGTMVWRVIRGLDEYTLVHYPAKKPLPKELAGIDPSRIHRILPYICISTRLSKDPDAAFGVAAVGAPHKRPFMFGIKARNKKHYTYKSNYYPNFKQPELEAIKKAPAGYNLYYIGDTGLTHDCELTDICAPAKRYCSATLGQFFDPANPNARFDVYVSMKYADGKIHTDEVILVKRQ